MGKHLYTNGEADANVTPISHLLNEELKMEEVRKIEKYALLLGSGDTSCYDWCLVETLLY